MEIEAGQVWVCKWGNGSRTEKLEIVEKLRTDSNRNTRNNHVGVTVIVRVIDSTYEDNTSWIGKENTEDGWDIVNRKNWQLEKQTQCECIYTNLERILNDN